MTDHYEIEHNNEGQFQSGSDQTVLKNQLGIVDSSEMDETELDLLIQLTDSVLDDITMNKF